jgi:hypothetical protein
MNISELIDGITSTCLSHSQIQQVQTGNVFDIATSKSSEVYPCVWIELPMFTTYVDRRKKTHSFSLNFLTLAKQDDLNELINKTSDMEICADEVLHALDDRFTNIGIGDITALTLRNFSDDDLCGVRVELTFTIGRVCDYKESFDVQV